MITKETLKELVTLAERNDIDGVGAWCGRTITTGFDTVASLWFLASAAADVLHRNSKEVPPIVWYTMWKTVLDLPKQDDEVGEVTEKIIITALDQKDDELHSLCKVVVQQSVDDREYREPASKVFARLFHWLHFALKIAEKEAGRNA